MTEATSTSWRTAYARLWGETIPTVLSTPYPYAAQHVSHGPDDVDVTPGRLHPAFHGCLDWHSSAHMQWSAIRLLTIAPDDLGDDVRSRLIDVLDERLTTGSCRVEADYLRANPRFERPYGWGWAAMLALAARECPLPQAATWAEATAPLLDVVADLVVDWLPKLAYPVRHGEHSNVAFGLSLVLEAAQGLGRQDVVAVIEENARRWFLGDREYPSQWEPSGSDFLSPALCEVDLMRRVLPEDEYAGWLAAFLPHLAADGDPLLDVPEVLDRTDGKAVHLFGLALSRAWQLRLAAPFLDAAARRRVAEATRRQVEQVEREIVEGDFMSTHWLVSFALLAVTVDGA
jgi:hypothetical protein